jgi:hypothetical protein
LQVRKNRYDGEIGDSTLAFNPDNKRYFEITDLEKQNLLTNRLSYDKLLKERINKYGAVEPLELDTLKIPSAPINPFDIKLLNKIQRNIESDLSQNSGV